MNNNRIHFRCRLAAALLLLAFFMPVLLWGQGVHILIHDNLDSVFLNAKILSESGMLWAPSSTVIDTYNIPRLSLGTQFNVIPYLFMAFGPFAGYIANLLLLKITAFVGMCLLLNRIYPEQKERGEIILTYSAAACFAALPFFSMAGLSVAGLPLAAYALINFYYRTHRWSDWAIILFMPFYTNLFYSFFFLLIFAGAFFCWISIKERRPHIPYLCALATMAALYVMVEYRLFINMLDPVFEPHRSEFTKEGLKFSRSLKEAGLNFINGQYHVPTNHKTLIIPFLALCLSWSMYKKHWKSRSFQIVAACVLTSLLISIFYGFWEWKPIIDLRENASFLKEFNLSRFHWLHPFLWYTAFGAALFGAYHEAPRNFIKPLVILLAMIQAGSNLVFSERYEFLNRSEPGSYREFVASSQFSAISDTIGKDKSTYRIASIGIHPSIAAYNGFQTVDFYMAYYPLSHKKNLYAAMEDELERAPELKQYYLDWGNRAYLFTAKTGKHFLTVNEASHSETRPPYKAAFNNKKLQEMGAEYLVSRIRLAGYELLGTFPAEKGRSMVTLYLYKI